MSHMSHGAGSSSASRPPAGPIAVIGASRGTGLQCVLYLAKRKLPCRAVARDPAACEKAVSAALSPALQQYVTYVRADVTKPKTLSPAVRGCAGAIFAATAPAGWRLPFASDLEDTPPHVDFEGCVAAATAAAAEGVARFVLISSASVTQPSFALHMTRNSLMGRIMDWKLLGEQGAAKVYDAVQQSTARDLSLTIVRPGRTSQRCAAKQCSMRTPRGWCSKWSRGNREGTTRSALRTTPFSSRSNMGTFLWGVARCAAGQHPVCAVSAGVLTSCPPASPVDPDAVFPTGEKSRVGEFRPIEQWLQRPEAGSSWTRAS
ncbi:hypothetical protein T484DRAFT_2638601 [Baffinella frigidus]|nr:hypothetical protein T484DRAFT_2638601 [Cryptophyta sp. CCMP2293]